MGLWFFLQTPDLWPTMPHLFKQDRVRAEQAVSKLARLQLWSGLSALSVELDWTPGLRPGLL